MQSCVFRHMSIRKRNLQVDSAKSNPLFDNWKLCRGLSVSENVVKLGGPVTVVDHSTDYLNTHAAVLHNHLHCQYGRFFVFKTLGDVFCLYQVLVAESATFKKVWGAAATLCWTPSADGSPTRRCCCLQSQQIPIKKIMQARSKQTVPCSPLLLQFLGDSQWHRNLSYHQDMAI